MLDPEIQPILEATSALPGPPAHLVPVEQARAAHDLETAEMSGPGEEVAAVRELAVPGPGGPIGVRVFRPAVEGALPLVAYVHGGGWVIGTLDAFDPLCRALANASGAVIASIDYRLAPEHPFPAAPDDVRAAVRWLAAHAGELGADPKRMGIAGDSAGGNLATVTARRLRDEGGPALRFQALIYPVCDSALSTPSYREMSDGFGLTAASMQRYWELYLDGSDGRHPDASPLQAGDLSGLPPAFVLTVRDDVLRDEAESYARALAAAGVGVVLSRYDGAVHGFFRWMARSGDGVRGGTVRVHLVRYVQLPTTADLDAAAEIVAARLKPTPLVPAPALGEDVHLKLETFQPTGSFKVRGGLAALSRAGSAPVVTASAGNAGLGVAWAAAALGVDATVVVAETASPAKVAALEALPVTLIQHGPGYDAAEARALELAAQGATYVSAYNDTGVIAGQATLGRELDTQIDRPVTVACPLGGGGLASGLGLWAAGRDGARVVAAEADRSPAFTAALAAGEITPVDVGETLADGLAGNVEPGSATFPLVRDHVDAVALVSEAEIEEAMRFLARAHGIVAEGAGAVAVAAAMTGRLAHGDGALVIVVTGRNIALGRLASILAG